MTPESEPKEQNLEIERRFKVDELPREASECRMSIIDQGYIGEERIRREIIMEPFVYDTLRGFKRMDFEDVRYYLTKKKGEGLVREQGKGDLPIEREEFNRLWPATKGKRISKNRYFIPYASEKAGEKIIELDDFRFPSQAYLIAEVEFDSVREAKNFKPPEWFGEEVTDNPSYNNINLAR